MLLLVGDSLSVVGGVAGSVSKETVRRWRAGERKPEDKSRRCLSTAYGIPIEAWDMPPRSVAAVSDDACPGEAEVAPSHESPGSSAEHFEELIRDIRRIKKQLGPADQLRATKDEGSLRVLKDKALEKVARLWDRTIRESPQWQRFEERIMRTLDRFPDAKEALREVFEKEGPL